jgi:hypothetical protein
MEEDCTGSQGAQDTVVLKEERKKKKKEKEKNKKNLYSWQITHKSTNKTKLLPHSLLLPIYRRSVTFKAEVQHLEVFIFRFISIPNPPPRFALLPYFCGLYLRRCH